MNLIAKLLTLAEAYSEATGTNLRLLGDRIFGDRRRIEKLQAGEADLTIRSYETAMLWFAENWPEGTKWPEGVPPPLTPERFDEMVEPTDEAAA
jgi:hypothetical protein